MVSKEYLKDTKTAIEYLNCVKDAYQNIDDYNPGKKHEILSVFDVIIADMLSKKNLNQQTLNYSFVVENQTFYLYSSQNHALLLQKMFD